MIGCYFQDELEAESNETGKEFNRELKNILEPSGAQSAYENVRTRIEQIDDDQVKTGEGLVLNLLHEKAHELSRFATRKEPTIKEELL